jgi:gas vesicle protein
VQFIVGMIVGFAMGVVSSIVYSGQSGQDLREVYKDVRKNVESVDLEQFGKEVQANVADAQAQVQANVAQVQANVAEVQAQVGEKVAQVRGTTGGNGSAKVEATTETATE